MHLVERDRGDFAVTMARLLVLSTYLCELYARLQTSTDPTLAAVAAKAVKEVDYTATTRRCGCCASATAPTSRTGGCRPGSTLEWAYVEELFDGSYVDPELVAAGIAVDPATLRPAFDRRIADVLAEATLVLPRVPAAETGGRRGVHTDAMARCWAICRAWPASTPGRAGDGLDDARRARRAGTPRGTSPRRCSTRRCRGSPSRTSASSAPSTSTRPVSRSPSPRTYSGCPAMDAIRDDILSAFAPGRT